LNLGPHPYQVSRAQRCADRGFPRSLATVRGEGMRSYRLVPSQAVRASQAGPTAPVGDSSISLPAVAEAWPADAGTKHDQTGAVLVQGGTDPAPTPREPGHAPNANPQPLRRAIPTLTGAVLVVNAAWASSSALPRSPAADAAGAVSVRTRRWFVHLAAGLVPGGEADGLCRVAAAGAGGGCPGPGHGRAGDRGDGGHAGRADAPRRTRAAGRPAAQSAAAGGPCWLAVRSAV